MYPDLQKSAEFLVRQRIVVNRCICRFAGQSDFEKTAQWYRVAGNLAKKHWGKALTGGFMAYQAPETVRNINNLRNRGGNPYITADGHRKSTAATTLKTIGDWAWAIPGINLISGITIGLGANWLGNAIQNRADKRWARSQQFLADHGVDPTNIIGDYKRPGAMYGR